jgi:hypothetical protein
VRRGGARAGEPELFSCGREGVMPPIDHAMAKIARSGELGERLAARR